MNESSNDWLNLVLTAHAIFYIAVLVQGLGFYLQVQLFIALKRHSFPFGYPFWDDIINSLLIAFVFNSFFIIFLSKL